MILKPAVEQELRCPVNPLRLFMKIEDAHLIEGNVISIACQDCRKDMRKTGIVVSRVIHRFNVIGECLDTLVEK